MKIKKKNLIKKYNLPQKVIFCKKCTISNQRPRIIFDKLGVCSACNYRKFKNKVDWKKREKELIKLLSMHRSKNGDYDVIVPCSGGKDGSFVAHMLKYKYNMNPLCVTWSPLESTEIGRKNLKSFLSKVALAIFWYTRYINSKKINQIVIYRNWRSFSAIYLWPIKFSITNCSSIQY